MIIMIMIIMIIRIIIIIINMIIITESCSVVCTRTVRQKMIQPARLFKENTGDSANGGKQLLMFSGRLI